MMDDQMYLNAMRSEIRPALGCTEPVAVALAVAKAPYTDNALFVLDYPKDLNWSLAYERHLLSLPYTSLEERSASFAAVTEKELLALAEEILRPDCLALCIKADKRRIDEETLRTMLRSV